MEQFRYSVYHKEANRWKLQETSSLDGISGRKTHKLLRALTDGTSAYGGGGRIPRTLGSIY